MAYLLDANVFIQAKNLYYGLDFCPAFWDWLILQNGAGQVFSIEKVGDEIEAGADELATWAAERGPGFFVKPDAAMLPALSSVSTWASGERYEPAAVNTFLQVADYYLVAYALAHGHTVVTHEIASTSTKKIKVPTACIALGIKCMTPFGEPIVRRYQWTTEYSAKEYIDLLGTYSDHINLPPAERRALFSGITDLIDREYGGRVLKHYETVLRLQRKRQ